MKRFLICITALTLLAASASAVTRTWSDSCIYSSSWTTGANECAEIAGAAGIHSVVITSATDNAGAVLELYDAERSTQPATMIARIPLDTRATYRFDLWLSSGLTYRAVRPASGFNIITKKRY